MRGDLADGGFAAVEESALVPDGADPGAQLLHALRHMTAQEVVTEVRFHLAENRRYGKAGEGGAQAGSRQAAARWGGEQRQLLARVPLV